MLMRPRTTTELTTTISTKIANLLHLSVQEGLVEVVVRGVSRIQAPFLKSRISRVIALLRAQPYLQRHRKSPHSGISHTRSQTQMWTLFTTALARGTSTTQVSIMNTSTNFMMTAFLGFAIFGESLPPMWWAGAALLVAGNVIVGRKDETKDASAEGGYVPVPANEDELGRSKDDDDEDIVDLGVLAEDRNR